MGEESDNVHTSFDVSGIEGPLWIVDPLDGTRMFMAGEKRFGVIVAMVLNGETVAGWLYEPLGGRQAACELGGGLRLHHQEAAAPTKIASLNMWNCKIATADETPMSHALTSAYSSVTIESRPGCSCSDLFGSPYQHVLGRNIHRASCAWDHLAGSTDAFRTRWSVKEAVATSRQSARTSFAWT
jgi:fructose-1,6-bisphosphatase/inositol monophosphatase family enzyme